MIAEVVAVGTELLLGQIVNTNAAAIGQRLADLGLDAHFQTVVGDNPERLASVLATSMTRSDIVLVTGGIGPTPDDITREALCSVTGRPMAFDEEYAEELADRFAAMGREMPANNLRQAEYPEGAELIPNPKGTAPGLMLDHGHTRVFVMPGVPAEMIEMLDNHVVPRIRQVTGQEVVSSRILRTWGISESAVAEHLVNAFDSKNPSIAFLASAGEIKVRITAKAGSVDEADALIAPMERSIRDRLGRWVWSTGTEPIESVVLDEARSRGLTIATAESATGGMVAARLTSVPGSSDVFRGSVVAYAADVKTRLLDVQESLLIEAGPVSETTALAMVSGARRRLGADVAVSVTGSAGPDPLDQPVGTMVFAVETPDGSRARTLRLPGDRERTRTYASTAALHFLRLGIVGEWWSR